MNSELKRIWIKNDGKLDELESLLKILYQITFTDTKNYRLDVVDRVSRALELVGELRKDLS